ncbi:MAG: DUF1643 domain-containing protein [Pseudonocardia sp.]|nr:DUF1643 domain-containing protein [Pseudonocardia sp.]
MSGPDRGAVLSADGTYRYSLTRSWPVDESTTTDPLRSVAWVMLNPSIADAQVDDPTIRRVVGFTRRLGYRRAVVVNLYAYRATKPRMLDEVVATGGDPVGPDNDAMLDVVLSEAGLVVAAWGAHEGTQDRVVRLRGLAAAHGHRLHCLGRTKAGHPRHPLYLPLLAPLEPLP